MTLDHHIFCALQCTLRTFEHRDFRAFDVDFEQADRCDRMRLTKGVKVYYFGIESRFCRPVPVLNHAPCDRAPSHEERADSGAIAGGRIDRDCVGEAIGLEVAHQPLVNSGVGLKTIYRNGWELLAVADCEETYIGARIQNDVLRLKLNRIAVILTSRVSLDVRPQLSRSKRRLKPHIAVLQSQE